LAAIPQQAQYLEAAAVEFGGKRLVHAASSRGASNIIVVKNNRFYMIVAIRGCALRTIMTDFVSQDRRLQRLYATSGYYDLPFNENLELGEVGSVRAHVFYNRTRQGYFQLLRLPSPRFIDDGKPPGRDKIRGLASGKRQARSLVALDGPLEYKLLLGFRSHRLRRRSWTHHRITKLTVSVSDGKLASIWVNFQSEGFFQNSVTAWIPTQIDLFRIVNLIWSSRASYAVFSFEDFN
jgi:hypothetical protein